MYVRQVVEVLDAVNVQSMIISLKLWGTACDRPPPYPIDRHKSKNWVRRSLLIEGGLKSNALSMISRNFSGVLQ